MMAARRKIPQWRGCSAQGMEAELLWVQKLEIYLAVTVSWIRGHQLAAMEVTNALLSVVHAVIGQ